jgi:hypothetical protein
MTDKPLRAITGGQAGFEQLVERVEQLANEVAELRFAIYGLNLDRRVNEQLLFPETDEKPKLKDVKTEQKIEAAIDQLIESKRI